MSETGYAQNYKHLFMQGGGEMGRLTRDYNWIENTLGEPALWPQSLKTTLSIILNSKFPMFLWWGPELICFYNDAYRPSLGNEGKHPSILGMPAKQAWPEIWEIIQPLMAQVLAGGDATWSEDQLIPIYRNGHMEDVYWTFSYSPVTDESGAIMGVLVTCTETTNQVITRQKLEEKNRELELAIESELQAQRKIRENERNLRQIILQAPVAIAIFRGPEYVVEIANSRALELWGRQFPEVQNKPIMEAMPELKTQGIQELLDNVYKTGEPFVGTEVPVELLRNGQIETAYINFVYEPLYDSDGKVNGLITIGTEVTIQFLARKAIEDSEAELLTLNDQLSSTNNALIEINSELAATQKHLQYMVNDLAASESRFRSLVQGAPVAIGVLNGKDFIIESANDMILTIWGKTKAILGRPLAVALPELKGQPFLQLLDDVYTSGKPYYGAEAMVMLEHEGKLQEMYFDFIYEPISDGQSAENTIMVVATDVTEQVNSRMELERVYEQARLSKEAAQLGTFDLDLLKGTMDWDDRCRTLFGISHKEAVSYEKDFVNGLHPDDRTRILQIIDDAFIKSVSNGDYDVEYRTVGAEDNKLRWVRAKGKVYFDAHDKPVRFIGSVLDITEQKLDEIRKNDFIGMVSHELKTPLTTLTAIVQVLNPKLKNNEDAFIAGALDKANIQVKKMSTMINGFLNISRLESGKIVVDKQNFELGELIKEMISETALTVASHRVNFKPCPPIMVNADRDKIGSVISNLLSNAIKYSPKGNLVQVSCEVKDKVVQVGIKDDGIGIKQQDIDKLFDRYYRVDSKNTAHISGFGIGLYLSAEIIQRHEGKIWAESDGVNGSTFYFTLPLS